MRFLVLVSLVSCGGSITDVKTGPGTSYPYGVQGIVCETQKTCCPQDYICGGEPSSVGCSKDDGCCFVGSGDEAKVKKTTPQTPQASK